MVLQREGFGAFYAEDNHCYLRHLGTKAVTTLSANPHRPFSKAERERRQLLAAYLSSSSEDDLIEGSPASSLRTARLPPDHISRPQGQDSGVRQG